MKVAMIIAAVLAGLFGFGLLLAPGGFYKPMGLTLTPMAATVAQAHGATLIGLGVIDWLARNFRPRELGAVAAGNLVVQVFSLVVAERIYALGAGAAVAPAFVIHIGLSALFVWVIVAARKRAALAAEDLAVRA